jgi:hypothetical protein
MAKEISVKFKATAVELSFQLLRQTFGSWIVRIALAVLFARMAMDFINGLASGREPDLSALFAILISLSMLPFLYIRMRLASRNLGEQTWRFSEEGITLQSPQVSSTYKWEHFGKVAADAWFYYLYYAKNASVYIPRRAFATPEKETAFRNLIPSQLKTNLK